MQEGIFVAPLHIGRKKKTWRGDHQNEKMSDNESNRQWHVFGTVGDTLMLLIIEHLKQKFNKTKKNRSYIYWIIWYQQIM